MTVNLSFLLIHHLASCPCHLIYPSDQKNAPLLIINGCMLYLRDLVKISHLTKTSVRLCFWRLVGWPYLSETFLMWSNTGRGCNFRCGVLFLSETILITPPPCYSQSILAISRKNALNLWWANTHIDTQSPSQGFMHCIFLFVWFVFPCCYKNNENLLRKQSVSMYLHHYTILSQNNSITFSLCAQYVYVVM